MRRWLITLLLTQVFLGLIYEAQATDPKIDFNKPGNYVLGICKTDIQMDCLEPQIKVTHEDGTTSIAQFIYSQISEPFVDNKNLDIAGFHSFKYPSGHANGYLRGFLIRVTLATPRTLPTSNLEVRVRSSDKKLKANECDENLLKLCTRYNLDPEDIFEISVRSQKLPVHWTGAAANNGDIIHQDYLSGDRWILTGSQELAGWNPALSWGIAAVAQDNQSSFFKDIPRCSQYGVLFLSSNGVTGGLPSWNKKTNSLNFGVFGPHLDANGDLNKGFFKARIPKLWLDCTFPENNLTSANHIVVNITYDDGAVQIATTQTRITKDIIYIDVPVMHFSSPTIQLINAALAPSHVGSTPTSSATAKASSIKCSKGKSMKKVASGKCPKGWKLVP